MRYDPVKDRLGALFQRHAALQRLFFALLHLVFLRSWYVRRALRRTLGKIRGPIEILDAGTGFGQYAWFIVRTFPEANVLAVDVKEDYLRHARAFFDRTPHARRVRFACEDLTELHAEGPFDCVLSVDVMEHIEDDRAVLRHFERVLRRGGCVVVNTPSDRGGSDVRGEGEGGFIEEHVRDGYGLAELEGKLRDAGLEPVRSLYTYGRWGSAAWRMLVKIPITLLNASWAWAVVLVPYGLIALPAGLFLNWLDLKTDNAEGTGLLVVARKP